MIDLVDRSSGEITLYHMDPSFTVQFTDYVNGRSRERGLEDEWTLQVSEVGTMRRVKFVAMPMLLGDTTNAVRFTYEGFDV